MSGYILGYICGLRRQSESVVIHASTEETELKVLGADLATRQLKRGSKRPGILGFRPLQLLSKATSTLEAVRACLLGDAPGHASRKAT